MENTALKCECSVKDFLCSKALAGGSWNRTHAVKQHSIKKLKNPNTAYVNCVYPPKELRINPILTCHCCFYTEEILLWWEKLFWWSCALVIIQKWDLKSGSGWSKVTVKAHFAIKKYLVEMIHLFSLFANSQISNCQIKW